MNYVPVHRGFRDFRHKQSSNYTPKQKWNNGFTDSLFQKFNCGITLTIIH